MIASTFIPGELVHLPEKIFKKNFFLSMETITGAYLLSLVAYATWLWNGLPYHSDLLQYTYPERAFNLEEFQKGYLPLWNPYLACGVPHLANWQSACFYPPAWLLSWMGLPHGLIILTLLQGAWAYAGFFLWLRSEKINGSIRALGALSFAGSAYFVHCWVNLHFIATASWIPWVFWSLRQFFLKKSLKSGLFLVFCLSLQLLAGYPIFVFYTGGIAFLWVLTQHPTSKQMACLAGLVGLSLLVTAAQWLPFLEYLTFTSHGNWKVFPYYLHPWEFLTLVHATALGLPEFSNYHGNPSNALFGNLYFGLVPLGFWLASLFRSPQAGRFWKVLAPALLAWMAAPACLPYGWVPSDLWNFLEPSKALGLFLFAVSTVVCKFLFQAYPSAPKGPQKILFLGMMILWLFDLLFLPYRLTTRVPNPFQNPSLQQETEQLREKTGGKRYLALRPSYQFPVEATDFSEMDKQLALRLTQAFLPNTNAVWGLRSFNAYFSQETESLQDISRYLNHGFPYEGDLLDIAGVKIILMPQPLPPKKFQAGGKMGDNNLSLNLNAGDDSWWVGKAVELAGRPTILNVLARSGSQWRKKVYLEKDAEGSQTFLPGVSRPLASLPDPAFNRPCGNRVAFPMDSPSRGWDILNESYAPGWHAWVDGRPTAILRAYGLFMAVPVAAGPHQVEFRYEPASFRLGLFISLAALALVLAGALRGLCSPVRLR